MLLRNVEVPGMQLCYCVTTECWVDNGGLLATQKFEERGEPGIAAAPLPPVRVDLGCARRSGTFWKDVCEQERNPIIALLDCILSEAHTRQSGCFHLCYAWRSTFVLRLPAW